MELEGHNIKSKSKLEGYMEKWTNCCSGWQRRYFILSENILFYYITKGMRYKGKIHLQIAEVVLDEKNDVKFMVDTGIQKFYLRTENSSNRKKWFDAIDQAIRKEQISIKNYKKNEKRESFITFKSENNRNKSESCVKLLTKFECSKQIFDGLHTDLEELKDFNYNPNDELQKNLLFEKYKVNNKFIFLYIFKGKTRKCKFKF